jgi:hypothetical protein
MPGVAMHGTAATLDEEGEISRRLGEGEGRRAAVT